MLPANERLVVQLATSAWRHIAHNGADHIAKQDGYGLDICFTCHHSS